MGAPASPSGSRASHETPSGSHPTGFDPSRSIFDCWRAYADRLYRSAETRREFEREYQEWYLAKFGVQVEVTDELRVRFFPIWATYRMAFRDVAGVIGDADAAIVASNDYIAKLQEYVEAVEAFIITQDGALWGVEANCEMRGKKHWQRFVKARDAIAASGTLTGGGDVKQAPGDSLSGPTREAGDAQKASQ
jgi:hypothetical protein